MKIAVMQPYFFPYLGYFQLFSAVDVFVMYDDVNFIKKGWVNRNYILMHCRAQRITVPLSKASQFRHIADTMLMPDDSWRTNLLKTLRQAYAKAPFLESVYALAEGVITGPYESIGELARASIQKVAAYLGLSTHVRPSSKIYANQQLAGEARILDICRREHAVAYYNLPGGEALYDPRTFAAAGVDLRFIRPGDPSYMQFACPFVPRLSILDVLMFNSAETVSAYLADYETAS